MSIHDSCIKCDAGGVDTIDSRRGVLGRYRRKECRECGHRWSTIEMAHTSAQRLASGKTIASIERVEESVARLRKELEGFGAELDGEAA